MELDNKRKQNYANIFKYVQEKNKRRSFRLVIAYKKISRDLKLIDLVMVKCGDEICIHESDYKFP